MGWLVSYTLASMAAAFVVVKIFDYIFAGMANGTVSTARALLFIGTWVAVTAQMGMNKFTKRVRQLRHGITDNILSRVSHHKRS